ncbi:MAG TPA: hypothetical protein VK831_03445 [Candidatus Deferrimicrobiaceae bacterium]|nr:hypothetical protein [Candidatus Deferrimicrobiaceae bacterium]
MTDRLAVVLEVAPKKSLASALDWPGWSRSGKTPEGAIESLLAYAPRFQPVAREAGLSFPSSFEVDLVEQLDGGSGTDFGVPSRIHEPDRQPVDAVDADRLARIVAAAWATFDRVAAGAPAELRKGPRGGGRDRDRMVGHVIDSDWYYAREIGIRVKQPRAKDRETVEAIRARVLDVLRQPSDGSPLADRKWTARYAYRRIAWHALDHAWEIEDRSGEA